MELRVNINFFSTSFSRRMAEAEALRAQMEEEMAREMAEYERKVSFLYILQILNFCGQWV